MEIVIGKYTYGAENIKPKYGQANLRIGKFCSIAQNITIYLGGNHRIDWITTYPFGTINQRIFKKFDGKGHSKTNGDVIIENDVWIGDNVSIMSGVKIENGAVISANSVVYNRVRAYSVVGGNPATFWFLRFDEETIRKLLKLKWWDFDEKTIDEISPILCSGDYTKLFEIYNIK